jgi:hypothetical protein
MFWSSIVVSSAEIAYPILIFIGHLTLDNGTTTLSRNISTSQPVAMHNNIPQGQTTQMSPHFVMTVIKCSCLQGRKTYIPQHRPIFLNSIMMQGSYLAKDMRQFVG